MVTRTGAYALRALIHLAQHDEQWPIPGKEIAAKAGIPAKYLAAVLGDLVRAGVLQSARGKTGGFSLARPAKKTALYDVLVCFEPVLAPDRPCPFSDRTCNDDDPCLGHDAWKKVREGYNRYLRRTSIFDVAFGRSKKRSRVQIKLR